MAIHLDPYLSMDGYLPVGICEGFQMMVPVAY